MGTSESFPRQQKRFRADKVAMRPNGRLNPQTLKRQVLCCVWENEFEGCEESGISGANSAQNFREDGGFAFRGN
jgi:hypothetical protein